MADKFPHSLGPYTVLSSEIKYQNPWIKVREDVVIRPGGSRGFFGIVEMVPGSSVVPLNDNGEVYLAREFKYGVERETLEVISGAINADEMPLDAGKRELREELGLVASKWTALGVVDPFTTVVSSPNYLFLAEGLMEGDANPDEGEVLHLEKMPLKKALDLVLSSEITHSASCVAILRVARILGIT